MKSFLFDWYDFACSAEKKRRTEEAQQPTMANGTQGASNGAVVSS